MADEARRLKLPQLTKLTVTRSFIESTQHLYTEIASEAMPIYATGVAPTYEATPAKAAPDEVYPNDPRSSEKIIE